MTMGRKSNWWMIKYTDKRNFSGLSYTTGPSVGDTAEKVKELYGEPTAIEEDGLWIYSSRGYDLFYITIKDNTVAAIKVSQVM